MKLPFTTTQRTLQSVLVLLLLFFSARQNSLSAQCTLACNGSLEFPLELSLTQSCMVTVTNDLILEAEQLCPGDKLITIEDSLSNFIAEGVNMVDFDGSAYLDQVLSATITDVASGLFCVGFFHIEDNALPTISNCEMLTLGCMDSTHPDDIGYPTVTDNCDANPQLSYIDNFMVADCLTDTAGMLTRVWTVTDVTGNTTSCVQEINILRSTLMDVDFPADITLSCDNPNADVSVTGVPTLDGGPLMNGDLCGLDITFSDDTIFICNDYMYRIEREWEVVESCSNFIDGHMQFILVADNEGPQITCPAPETLIFSTDASQPHATISLPTIVATDNCGDSFDFDISTSYEGEGFGPHLEVPVGTHTVTYTVTDECGNPTSCETSLQVIDDLAPTAICDDLMIVAISTQGVSVLPAFAFDEGSSDNFASEVFYKAKRTNLGGCAGMNEDVPGAEWFDDQVVFCCQDIANNAVSVTLRVYDTDPGYGAVNPTRELDANDLEGHFTECQSTITIQDAMDPIFIGCPQARTITCDEPLDDLSIYGHIVVEDNCSFVGIDSTVVMDINDCGEGTILRSWTAIDHYNNSAFCAQLITVENTNILPIEAITWPEDYTTYECGANIAIENLPIASQYPVVNWDGCGNIGVSHEDVVFNLSQPACYKVLRTWTIIDWCHHNSGLPDSPGKFTYIQEIKVKDNQRPAIVCPDDITVALGANCDAIQLDIPLVTFTDCSPDITVTNDSPYAFEGGANASGEYPASATLVTYAVTDGCNNTSLCEVNITVEENTQGPNINCILGLTATLENNNNHVNASITADAFVNSTSFNCGNVSDVTYTIRKVANANDPFTAAVTFDCNELDAQSVEILATDSDGNTGNCITVVTIQDHQNYCLPISTMGMIAGGVLTENGEEVENVYVNVSGYMPATSMTSIDGSFEINDLPAGESYIVTASNNENILNGVSTFDLILMSKHVLGVNILDSPYKIIAADVDRSGHVSTLDIIKLRKLILQIDTELPNGNSSWRFVDANYIFPDPTNPFVTYFPETFSIDQLQGSEMHADFVGIKVGDVNGNASPNSYWSNTTGNRNNDPGMVVSVEDASVEPGDIIEIPFTASYMNEMAGYQFTLEFDPEALYVEEIVPGDLPNVYEDENFGYTFIDRGMITTIWNEYGETAKSNESTLFILRCEAQQAGQLSDWLYISSKMTSAEAYTQDGAQMGVQLSVTSSMVEEASNFELFQNRPNPWKNETIIPFQLDFSGDAQLTVYDMAGKIVYQTGEYYDAGYQEIAIHRSDLPAIGMFFYTLEAGDQRATRKMVLTD